MDMTLSMNGMHELSMDEQRSTNGGGWVAVAIVVVVLVVAVVAFAAGVYNGYKDYK